MVRLSILKLLRRFKKAADLGCDASSSISTNAKDDLLAKILGPDNPGRLRAMGRGMSMAKLACLEVSNTYLTRMQENQIELQLKVRELQCELVKLQNQKQDADQVGENSAPRSVNKISHPKCVLVDWSGSDESLHVAEGRVLSTDPEDLLNGIPLGPNDVKVLVETSLKGDAYLWRPTVNMLTIEAAVGEMIPWPTKSCLILDRRSETEDNVLKSPRTDSANKCTIMSFDGNVVAEGRWQSREPNTLVNGIPIGPSGVQVFVDEVIKPETFLWRPTAEIKLMEDALKTYIAWPANNVVFRTTTDEIPEASTHESPPKKPTKPVLSPTRTSRRNNPEQVFKENQAFKENQKCKILDCTGKTKKVVAIGRWSTNNPEQLVHGIPLGPNAVRVWIDVVKVKDAEVWRTTSEFETIEDAHGSTIAWPEDKVVIYQP